MKEGAIADATIIQAPPSTKNREGQRDPEMHQTKKGNQWHFGMKLRIGVDAATGIAHSMVTTGANAHGATQAGKLLHGKERRVWGDAGYTGVGKREENRGLDVEWLVALKPGKRRLLERGSPEDLMEQGKASVRAKVEHPFWPVKGILHCGKVRYRGLAKNHERLAALLGITNLLRWGKPLAA